MDELNTLSSKSTSVSEITLSLRLGEIVDKITKTTAISPAAIKATFSFVGNPRAPTVSGMWAPILVNWVVYHLSQIPGNSSWDVNGKRFFGSSHWKITETNGNSEKVVPFSRLGRSE